MFQDAIERVSQFTRPVHTILRTYGNNKIIPGAATLFFVNQDGYAITCKHIAQLILSSDEISGKYRKFKAEKEKLNKDRKYIKNLRQLESNYHYNSEADIQLKNTFMNCVDSMSSLTIHLHPDHDLVILKFNDFKVRKYQNFAVFKKDTTQVRQGEFLCRLGFPFPQFDNFRYNEDRDEIEWTKSGIQNSPQFPLEGMVTRFLIHNDQRFGIEMSTPGLRGQSGGPLFNKEGIVCGMQFSTKHLHLGFDMVGKEVVLNKKIQKVTDYSFLHLGQCIHADIIKNFLTSHEIKFYEE